MSTIAFLITFAAYCFLAWLFCRLFDYLFTLYKFQRITGLRSVA